jgi:heavy metal sensor kinase
MAGKKRDIRRLVRGLRFRLTAVYSLFFALLLIAVAAYFRARLSTTLSDGVKDGLNDEWAAVKGGFARVWVDPIKGKYVDWYYDPDDPDETTAMLDIKKVYLITDQYGHIVPDIKAQGPAVSTGYEDLGIEKPEWIQKRVERMLAFVRTHPNSPIPPIWEVRRNSEGKPFLIRSAMVWDQQHKEPFYVALGASFQESDRTLRDTTWKLAAVIPVAIILGSLLGWVMAGRALSPVHDVARAAQRISSSNLSLRIPSRNSGDELDYLILTFNRMIERLEASFRQMKQFSTDVSHELRTPITAIRGQIEVALFTAKTTDQYREAMYNAMQDIDRLSQIVRALLLLSQAESGQLALQLSPLNLCAVVAEATEQFQIPAEAAGITLTAQLPEQCTLEADRVQIERMITNLLSNAIKFTPEGGSVRVAVEQHEGTAELIVEDTGRGIAPEFLPHIFDRFYRVPGTGTAPEPEQGLGLGLSFVAWIAKAHHGVVNVESEPGKGTRFRIRIPNGGAAEHPLETAPTSHVVS